MHSPPSALRPLLATTCLVAAGLGLAACVDPPDEPEVSETEGEIRDGAIDTGHSFTVKVGKFCTGTLITPRWVLTANHCITGYNSGTEFANSDADRIKKNIKITVVPDGSSQDGEVFWHTNQKDGVVISGEVVVVTQGKLNLGLYSYWDGALDLALIKLDEPVPLSLAAPLNPPLLLSNKPTCPQSGEFAAKIIGFSNGSDGLDHRRSNTVSDWERDQVYPTRAIYRTAWEYPIAPLPEAVGFTALMAYVDPWGNLYNGIEEGDSGGPLLYSGRLCGVASGVDVGTWVCGAVPPGIPIFCMSIGNVYSAIDSSDAQNFLAAHIITTDVHGNPVLEGQCSVGGMVDSDDDGIWNGCDVCPGMEGSVDVDGDWVCDFIDNCPTVANPSQVDFDLDGWGDACDPCPSDGVVPAGCVATHGDCDDDGLCDSADNCPHAHNPDQRNSNFEWEVVHTAGDHRGDACEPVPQPVVTMTPTGSVSQAGPGGFWFGVFTEDSFELAPQRAQAANLTKVSKAIPYVTGPSPVCVGSAGCVRETMFRYCQPGPNHTPPYCDDAAALDQAQLHLEYASADDELPTDPWHRMTLDFHDDEPPARGVTLGVPYDSLTTYPITWLYDDDATYWIAGGQVAVPEAIPESPGMNLAGYVWAHVHTNVGHTKNSGAGLHGPQLANTITPIDVFYVDGGGQGPVDDSKKPYWNPKWPDIFDAILQIDIFTFPVALDLEAMPWFLDEPTAEALATGAWIGAEEQLPDLGAAHPLAMSFEDGQWMGLWMEGDRLAVRELRGPRGDLPFVWSRTPMTYSRRLGALLALPHAGGLWRLQLGDEAAWTRLDLALPDPRTVVDLTVSERGLYLLEQDGDEVRLRRIDLHHGTAALLGSWRRTRDGRLALGLDRQGLPVLTSADSRDFRFAGIEVVEGSLGVRYHGDGRGDLAYPITDTRLGPTAYLTGQRGVELTVPRLFVEGGAEALDALF